MGFFTLHKGGKEQMGSQQQNCHHVTPESEETQAVCPFMGNEARV